MLLIFKICLPLVIVLPYALNARQLELLAQDIVQFATSVLSVLITIALG